MKIAVLSGKGGTGKTFVTVNLAYANNSSVYIDCDVEEPNGHLFFKPKINNKKDVCVKIPVCNDDLCDGCKKCVSFCEFHALAYINNKLMLFDKICHSCGGCEIICPQKAISETDKVIGHYEYGYSGKTFIKTGYLKTGETTGIPIIKQLLKDDINSKDKDIFIDCPPGSSCSVIESIKDSDYCVLVAEPSVFGAHNLQMVHELVKIYNKPYGVILNKCTKDYNPSYEYCKSNNIDILESIDFDKELGLLNSNGFIAAKESTFYFDLFASLLEKIRKGAKI